MATKPTQSIFPIENGKLLTALDANNFPIHNLDVANSEGVGTGGGGGGNDTGTTTAILKGDGNHGFADAVAGTDYATAAAVNSKEDITDHDADLLVVTNNITGLTTDLSDLTTLVGTKADDSDITDALALKLDISTFESYQASNDSAVALKADDADLQAYITSNDIAVAAVVASDALKADDAATTASLALKADITSLNLKAAITYVDSQDALNEPLLPTTANDGFILARHNAGAGSAFYFVDPVTLGTTSATFTDGQSFTNTNYDSATAQFVTADLGKTITGTNIPASTTITGITSGTRVVLSQATTGTGGPGLTFTIINRLLTSNSGTVTNVSTINTTALFSIAVSNPTTTPVLGFAPSTATAQTFYGNLTGSTANPAFYSAATARASLGGTTVGQAIFQLTNPSQVGFIRTNLDNSVTALTPTATLTALGGEQALTFNAPIVRATNTISMAQSSGTVAGYLASADWTTFNSKLSGATSLATTAPLTGGGSLSAGLTLAMPAATDLVPGHLTAADHAAFNAKVGTTRTINTTAPLTGGGNLTADRTIAIPAASASADGYLAQGDFNNFTAKPPNSRTISTTAPLTGGGDLSANRTVSMLSATAARDGYLTATDFVSFSSGSPHIQEIIASSGAVVITASTPPITRVLFKTSISIGGSLNISLPNANLYGVATGYSFLELVDIASPPVMTNGSITLSIAGGNSIDGASNLVLPRGASYWRLNSDGVSRWTSVKYFVDSFRDATNANLRVSVDVTQQTAGVTGVLTLANGASVTVQPKAIQASKFLSSLSPAGVLTADNIYQKDVLSSQDDITATSGSHIVPNPGPSQLVIDNIRLSGTLTGPMTVVLPSTAGYTNGEAIFFYDASGSITSTNTVTLSPSGTDTINGGQPIVLNRSFDNRRIIANPTTSGWTVESYGGTTGTGLDIGAFVNLTDAAIVSVTCNPSITEQHWNLTGTSGIGTTRTVNILGARDGERFRINYTHYTTNDGFKISGSYTPGLATGTGGLGLLTLSTAGAGTLDTVTGIVGAAGQILVDNPSLNLTKAAPPAYSTLADAGPANTGVTLLSIGSTTATKFRAGQFVAGSSYSTGRVDLNVIAVGTPANITGSVYVSLANDAARSTDPSAILTSGSATVNCTTVVAADVGQRVYSTTGGAITQPAYIASVVVGTSFTMSANKDGTGTRTANSSTTGVSIFGAVGGGLGTSLGVLASGLPTSYSTTFTAFTGFPTPISITSGETYWIVAQTDSVASAVDFAQWKFLGTTGHLSRNGPTYPPGVTGALAKPNFNTYR